MEREALETELVNGSPINHNSPSPKIEEFCAKQTESRYYNDLEPTDLSYRKRKMNEDALFNLRWDAQRSSLLGSMAALYREESFVDTTIVADKKIFKAHKLLLSASSLYLKHMLESVPQSQHAVIFMPHISASDLGNLLDFIYDGEIKINRRSLKSFLSVAKLLKIKGMDFELNEDLELNVSPLYAQNLSTNSNAHKEDISRHRLGVKGNNNHANGQSTMDGSSTASSDEESNRATNPVLMGNGGRSSDSLSSQASGTGNHAKSSGELSPNSSNNPGTTTPKLIEQLSNNASSRREDDDEDTKDGDECSNKRVSALNLQVGRCKSESPQHVENDCHGAGDEGGGEMSIVENEMEEDYDDNDDDDSYSMSIQPEVSIRESDESFSLVDRQNSNPFKPLSFGNSMNLSLWGNPSMSITQMPSGMSSPLSQASSPLSFQPQMSFKQLSKISRTGVIPKAHQLSGQGSPHSGTTMTGINDGILMRMMREPLQTGTGKIAGSPNSGFFDIPHNDPNLHAAGLKKQKRYVQCNSCSKVLSSLSALKRHMEDVHCARIQGKCLLCGRVYSSRNSLLTHVYSAHKKHHDYKAVARIIRESDFEQFANV